MTKFKQLAYAILAYMIICSAFASSGFGGISELSDMRPPEQVFKVSVSQESSNLVTVNFDIASGFYIYQHRLKIMSDPEILINGNSFKIPSGFAMEVFDGQSNKVEDILNGKFKIDIPIAKSSPGNLIISLQGCDGKTICYPPQKYTFPLNQSTSWFGHLKEVFFDIYSGGASGNTVLNHANIFELILVFFIAGAILALTPCMYPLYPIALSALTGNTAKRSNIIKLTLCYIHGIALVYVLMGVLAATSGKLLTSLIQTPLFVLVSSGVLLLLGLAMFDLLEIKLPNSINSYVNIKANNLVGGRYTSAFLMGLISSLLLGPCVTPPLVITIGFIASVGSVLVGMVSLYALSLGLCLPIFILATLGSKFMPKSGGWMNIVKHILGVVIIAIAINLAYPLLDFGSPLLSVGILCFISTLAFLLIKQFQSPDLELLTHRVLPILMIGLGITFTIIGAKQISSGKVITEISVAQTTTTNVNDVEKVITTAKTPVIVIVSAKWCSICREMEATTFKDKGVDMLFQHYTVVDLDITDNNAEQITFLRSYNLYGPPAILIFDHAGKVTSILTGFIDVKTLLNKLK